MQHTLREHTLKVGFYLATLAALTIPVLPSVALSLEVLESGRGPWPRVGHLNVLISTYLAGTFMKIKTLSGFCFAHGLGVWT